MAQNNVIFLRRQSPAFDRAVHQKKRAGLYRTLRFCARLTSLAEAAATLMIGAGFLACVILALGCR